MGQWVWPLLLLVFVLDVNGQQNAPAKVFNPAIDEIWGKTPIPILLPSKLPAGISERDIKLASGSVDADGYGISLYYEEFGSNASFAASFAAFHRSVRDLPNVRRVTLANGIVGLFRPVSCGGSCAPANLWWEQNGVTYQIQIKLRSDTDEQEQEKILVECANSNVIVRAARQELPTSPPPQTPYTVLRSDWRDTGGPTVQTYTISVDKYLDRPQIERLICQVILNEKPRPSSMFILSVYYRLSEFVISLSPSYDPMREHQIGTYFWNKSLPASRRRIFIYRDADGNQVNSDFEFNDTVSCAGKRDP